MKSTIISLSIVLVLMVALPLIFLTDNWFADSFNLDLGRPGASDGVQLSSRIESVSTDTPVELYRWRDANGVLQFSNSKPEGVTAELFVLVPNLGTMPATPLPPEPTETAAAAETPADLRNPYTPGGMKQMVEQATELKDLLNQQQAAQQEAIEKLNPKTKQR